MSLKRTQELVAISKPGVCRRSLSAARGVKPSSAIMLVLARSMNSWEETWRWLLLKGDCWSSLWRGSLPARRAELRTANRPCVCAGKARCTAGQLERDFYKLVLWGVRVYSGDANPWSNEMISGSSDRFLGLLNLTECCGGELEMSWLMSMEIISVAWPSRF